MKLQASHLRCKQLLTWSAIYPKLLTKSHGAALRQKKTHRDRAFLNVIIREVAGVLSG
jgi:hypothetical protein